MGTVRDRLPLGWASAQPPQTEYEHEHWRITEEAIRIRAYFISLETGGKDPRADWLRAEAEFRAEAGLTPAEVKTGLYGGLLSH